MSSNGLDPTSIGKTLTSGIQDISALLPLLGTEQCEQHIGSALTGGYLYVAATPMSIFGSLGMAKAGFKALMASISIQRWRFVGAEKLRNAGFMPSGQNLSLIMIDPENPSRHLAETRLDSLLKDHHIEDIERLSVSSSCETWNVKMVILTAVFSILSLTPYIHLCLNKNSLPRLICWALPAVRALGGFLTATSLQFLTQRRILVILKKRLVFTALNIFIKSRLTDRPHEHLGNGFTFRWDPQTSSELCIWSLEEALEYLRPPASRRKRFHSMRIAIDRTIRRKKSRDTDPNLPDRSPTMLAGPEFGRPTPDLEYGQHAFPKESNHGLLISLAQRLPGLNEVFSVNETMWPFLVLMLFGIGASVVGYIGCFSIVQGSQNAKGALIWLCLEGVLSILRMALWGWNPDYQQPNPLKISLTLQKFAPLSTCNRPMARFASGSFEEEGTDPPWIPCVRAPEFLESVTSFAGLLTRFTYPNISLFYTFLRDFHPDQETTERVLCITVLEHNERTARMCKKGPGEDGQLIFAAVEPPLRRQQNVPVDHPAHHSDFDDMVVTNRPLWNTPMNDFDVHNDPVLGNRDLRTDLLAHYLSIINQIRFRINHPDRNIDVIENTWTLKLADTNSTMNRDSLEAEGYLYERPGTPDHQADGKHRLVNNLSLLSYMEYDDVNYVYQGHQQVMREAIVQKNVWMRYRFYRGPELDFQAEETLVKLGLAMPGMDLGESKAATETLNLILVFERAVTELIHLLEVCLWEWKLWIDHCDTTSMINDRRTVESGWDSGAFQRRMREEWNRNLYDRVSRDSKLKEKELDEAFELLGPGQTSSRGSSEVTEAWVSMKGAILRGWRQVLWSSTALQRRYPYEPPHPEYITYPFDDELSKLRRRIDSETSDTWKKFLKERESAMMYRLFHMEQDMRERVEEGSMKLPSRSPGLLRVCEIGDTGCVDVSSALDFVAYIDRPTNLEPRLHASFLRSKPINIIQVVRMMPTPMVDRYREVRGDSESLQISENLLRAAKDATSLTTILLSIPKLEDQVLEALEEIIDQNPNLTSIYGPDPRLKPLQAVLAKRNVPITSTNLSCYGFFIAPSRHFDLCGKSHLESLHDGGISKIVLRFIAPKKDLMLRFNHQQRIDDSQRQSVQTVTIQIETEGKFALLHTIAGSQTPVAACMQLLPGTHFNPGSPVTLTISPSCKDYQIRDLDLVDKDYMPYVAPDVDPYAVDEAQVRKYPVYRGQIGCSPPPAHIFRFFDYMGTLTDVLEHVLNGWLVPRKDAGFEHT
ncbi:hypothetical protein Hypma_002231 [Hypsizygus marmoreus]|uniref:Uncharacterized protein n=1 Tax=Hypsizygus marmoreus TaxID=39966 RepID=A0A369K2W7_HYPMA|nr:hypothetical protein Hypma_002231 [Hypsizygus marmoreus]